MSVLDHALSPRTTVAGCFVQSVLGHDDHTISYLASAADGPATAVVLIEYFPGGLVGRAPDDRTVLILRREDEALFGYEMTRFVQAGRRAQTLRHQNLIQVQACQEANGTAYVILKYEQGQTLASILAAQNKLPEPEIRKFLFPLLNVIGYLHRQGFLHRDIRPRNILLRGATWSPLLLGFTEIGPAIGPCTLYGPAVRCKPDVTIWR